MNKEIKIAVLQRVIPEYRLGLLKLIEQAENIKTLVFYGENLNKKVASSSNINTKSFIKLPTSFLKLSNSRIYPYHKKLYRHLYSFKPDIILCEGESNLINNFKVIMYRLFNPKVVLIHWSLGGIPSGPTSGSLALGLKKRLLSIFNQFVVYSSFGKEKLIELGCHKDKICVAYNVSNTTAHLKAAQNLEMSQLEARKHIGLRNRFTVVFAGSIDDQKRILELIHAVSQPTPIDCDLIILGDGPSLNQFKALIKEKSISNVFMLGKISWEHLATYYRASDLFMLPGLGGMVISEAMSHALPVAVYQADGIEHDLIQNNKNGFIMANNDTETMRKLIIDVSKDPDHLKCIGYQAQNDISDKFLLEHTASTMIEFLKQCYQKKKEIIYENCHYRTWVKSWWRHIGCK